MSECRVALFCLLLTLSGCGDSSGNPHKEKPAKSPPEHTESESATSTQATPAESETAESESSVTVEVISEGKPQSEKPLAAEHRSPKIVIIGAETPEQFEQAARNYFEKTADEIEAAVPESKNKRIDLRAYDNDVDAKSGSLCILHASNSASLRTPSWKKA